MRASQSVTLVPYQIRVKKHGKEEFCKVDDIAGYGFLTHLFRKFLKQHSYGPSNDPDDVERPPSTVSASVDEDDQVAFRVSNVTVSGEPSHTSCQTVEALVEIGPYGIATNLVNVQTSEERVRTKDEADMAPFYVRLDVHNGTDTALLVIQEYGRQHSRGRFIHMLKRYFREEDSYSGLVLIASSIVTDEYLQKLTTGGVKSIRCFRKLQPKDVSSELVDGLTDDIGQLEIIVRPPAKQWFRMKVNDVINAMKGLMPAGPLIGIESDPEYDRAKIEIDFGGRRRTINLNRREGLLPFMAIDVSDQLDYDDETNHPTFGSLRRAAHELVAEMAPGIGWDHVPAN